MDVQRPLVFINIFFSLINTIESQSKYVAMITKYLDQLQIATSFTKLMMKNINS